MLLSTGRIEEGMDRKGEREGRREKEKLLCVAIAPRLRHRETKTHKKFHSRRVLFGLCLLLLHATNDPDNFVVGTLCELFVFWRHVILRLRLRLGAGCASLDQCFDATEPFPRRFLEFVAQPFQSVAAGCAAC